MFNTIDNNKLFKVAYSKLFVFKCNEQIDSCNEQTPLYSLKIASVVFFPLWDVVKNTKFCEIGIV